MNPLKHLYRLQMWLLSWLAPDLPGDSRLLRDIAADTMMPRYRCYSCRSQHTEWVTVTDRDRPGWQWGYWINYN